jgi:ubiquinone/menaquinone biosynthesis C-methylase UbiE
MKYNMGCGNNKIKDYINVDKYEMAGPDLLCDLEITPWPFESNSADEILFNHSIEHMGQDPNIFLNIMREIYRISKPGGTIQINVPHPRHDNFVSDPTHVRPIMPMTLALFSKKNNDYWKIIGAANTPFAHYTGVDFEIIKTEYVLEAEYASQFQSGSYTAEQINAFASDRNNVISEFKFTLIAVK